MPLQQYVCNELARPARPADKPILAGTTGHTSGERDMKTLCLRCSIACGCKNISSPSLLLLLVCVRNHNWLATKQRLHPQSVAEISRHSVLSGDRIRQCGTSSGYRPGLAIRGDRLIAVLNRSPKHPPGDQFFDRLLTGASP